MQVANVIPALEAVGLNVIEHSDPESRGYQGSDMGTILGILCHHTAGAYAGDAPSLNVVMNGRPRNGDDPGLPGPLAHFLLARSGDVHFIAGGLCNHAGAGKWKDITAGNKHMIGIEAENAGYDHDIWNTRNGEAPTGWGADRFRIVHKADPWPETQMIAYAKLCAAIVLYYKLDVSDVAGHKEYALPRGRKSDPSFDMTEFRNFEVKPRIEQFRSVVIPQA